MFWVASIVLLGVLRQCEGGNLRRGDCGISSDVRIIISVTESYLDILSNWLVFYYRVCPDLSLIHLLCFDSGLQEPMAAYGLPCRSTFSSNTHKSVFTKRVEVAMTTSASDMSTRRKSSLRKKTPLSPLPSLLPSPCPFAGL